MRVEWKSTTMINGVQCVMISGVSVMYKLFAVNWVLVKQLMHHVGHLMDRVVVLSGLIIYFVLVMNQPLEIVYIMDGESTIVRILKMLVQIVLELLYVRTCIKCY